MSTGRFLTLLADFPKAEMAKLFWECFRQPFPPPFFLGGDPLKNISGRAENTNRTNFPVRVQHPHHHHYDKYVRGAERSTLCLRVFPAPSCSWSAERACLSFGCTAVFVHEYEVADVRRCLERVWGCHLCDMGVLEGGSTPRMLQSI